MKVIILTTVKAPYRVDLFNELGKVCDLTVCFEQEHDIIREKDWYCNEFNNFNGVVLKNAGKSISKIKGEFIDLLKKGTYDLCVFYEYSTNTSMLAMVYCISHKIRFAINCDGAIISKATFKDKIKSYFIKRATACLANGKSAEKYFLTHKAKYENIYNHYFCSFKESEILSQIVTMEEKHKLRKAYNLPNDGMIVLSVGMFNENKGFQYLLDCFNELKNSKDIYLLLVGGGPLKSDYMKFILDHKLENVIIKDFMPKVELIELFKAVDVFSFLTLTDVWGLVVVEAMSQGLPVISSKFANSSLELIQNGHNGYLCELDNHDIKNSIVSLHKSYELRDLMGKRNLVISKQYTIENNAKQHLDNFKKILEG